MIEELTLRRFKRFRDQTIPLRAHGVSLVAGANNSGKSSILHALAVWEFCRTIIEAEKGAEAFLASTRVQGLGLGDDEFSPLLVPSLGHLWTNLTTQKTAADDDGYTLRIRASWRNSHGVKKELEFGLALANDRLFVKRTFSTLDPGDDIPRVAYLPPFAGITDKEARLPGAIRRRRIGEGLAGAVLRNVLLDLYQRNFSRRAELRGSRTKIRDADLRDLRESDSWEILQQTLRIVFGSELTIQPFRDEYHSYIKVEIVRGTVQGYRISRHQGYKNRDLMVEGSGFLQWLSVFALATDRSISTLLLDEPDAHLHTSLQGQLLERLNEIAESTGKQVLIATHSSEILRSAPLQQILRVTTGDSPKYLSNESQKVGLLAGLGSEYSPRIDHLRRSKRLLFVEGDNDVRVLRKVADLLGIAWPTAWTVWKSTGGHKERKHLFIALTEEVEGLVTLSLRDRDDEPVSTVGEHLEDRTHNQPPPGFHCRKWRRRHIESYLLWPPAMAAASGRSEQEIREMLQERYAIAVGSNFSSAHPPDALLDIRGKDVLAHWGIDAHAVVAAMTPRDVPEDLRMFVQELVNLAL